MISKGHNCRSFMFWTTTILLLYTVYPHVLEKLRSVATIAFPSSVLYRFCWAPPQHSMSITGISTLVNSWMECDREGTSWPSMSAFIIARRRANTCARSSMNIVGTISARGFALDLLVFICIIPGLPGKVTSDVLVYIFDIALWTILTRS